MRAFTRICATPAVTARIAGCLATPLLVRQYQRRSMSLLASPTAVNSGWFSNLFGKADPISAAPTVDSAAAAAAAHNGEVPKRTTPGDDEASQVSAVNKPMVKPYETPVRRLRLDIVAKLMHAALKRLQEANFKDLEHKIYDTRNILATIRSKIDMLKKKLREAEMRITRRIT